MFRCSFNKSKFVTVTIDKYNADLATLPHAVILINCQTIRPVLF